MRTRPSNGFANRLSRGTPKRKIGLAIVSPRERECRKTTAKLSIGSARRPSKGYPDAQNHLGVGYAEGFGVGKDLTKALQWFRKAAEAGDVGGQRNLGHVLAQGQGTPVDVVEAYQWLSVAAEKGDKGAKNELDGLTKKLSQGQLKRGRERAAAFSRLSAGKPAPVE